MSIYLNQDGARTGPYTVEEVRDRLARGVIRRDTWAWVEGSSQWVPVGQVADGQIPAAPAVMAEPRYAGFWLRVVAYLIDAAILWIPLTIAEELATAPSGQPVPTIWAVQFGAWWVYTAACHSSSWRATLGKRAVGIQVTDLEGQRISFGHATGRFIAELASTITLGLGYLVILFNRKRQALHDVVAGTVVTRR